MARYVPLIHNTFMTGLLTLLDDIASTLDDIALMSKVAMKKTSALMTDDLAVNAGVLQGAKSHREIPIVFKIFLGSLVNKVIAIGIILLLLKFYPPLVDVLLFSGGLYLSYEGVHKLLEKFFSPQKEKALGIKKTFNEKEKIFGAIKTDLILSFEIIVIANSTLLQTPFFQRSLTLMSVGLGASLIIYGLVAIIVKIDDFGLWLMDRNYNSVGLRLVEYMPYVMKGLGIVGTAAMLLVGGGIINHLFHVGHLLPSFIPEFILNGILGLLTGLLCVGAMVLFQKIRGTSPQESSHTP